MSIKLIIFDWSGVISDDRRPVYEVNMKILRDYNKPTMSFEEWLPRTTMTPIELLANHGVHGNPDKLFNLYKKYFDEEIESGIVPRIYPDVHNVFKYLKEKGKRLAVLSSHPTDNLRKEAGHYNLTSFFDLIYGDLKDKAKGLQNICSELDIKPEFALYIGDTIYDIRAAKEAGVHSGGVCQGYHTKERLKDENPEFLLKSLSELKNKEIF